MRDTIKHIAGFILLLVLRLRRLFRFSKAAAEPRKVVLLADIGLGNAVMALPFLNSLRLNRPGLHITILTTPGAAALFKASRLSDQIVILKSSPGKRILQAVLLRREAFDICFVTFPTLSLPSELLPLWLGAKENVIHDCRSIQPFFHYIIALYTALVVLDESLHDVEQNLALLPAGWRAQNGYPAIEISTRGRESAALFLKEHDLQDPPGFFAFHPGGKQGADYKRWPVQRYRALAKEINQKYAVKTVVILGPDEQDLLAELDAPFLIPLCTNDLEITIAVLEKSRYFISNDSGIMHVATLLDKPLFTIWGATDANRNGGWSNKAINIAASRISCRPCIRFVPEGTHIHCQLECIRSITAAEVFAQVNDYISSHDPELLHQL
jgi:heptosyltransferase II